MNNITPEERDMSLEISSLIGWSIRTDNKKLYHLFAPGERWVMADTNYDAVVAQLPAWPRSFDVALALPIPPNGQWNLIYQVHGQDASVATLVMDMEIGFGGPTYQSLARKGELALAMCRAWLEMKRREADRPRSSNSEDIVDWDRGDHE